MRLHRRIIPVVVALLSLVAVSGCSSGDLDPKQTVIRFFGAMERDDQAALTALLDLPALMGSTLEDYSLKSDTPRVFTNPEQLLEDLTGDGFTKKRWFALQRIIGESEVSGESATVEVTFVDKEKSRGYLTKFGLHVVNGKWRIYSFRTFQEPPGSAG